ncbi:MAG: hypothetical protein LBE35_02350 [Clostridiales bacterium]|jgi:hypothetical protein|nr:hypothetical protein [Clostridiales bacterium]
MPVSNEDVLERRAFTAAWDQVAGATSISFSMRNINTNAFVINAPNLPGNTRTFVVQANQLIVGHRYVIEVLARFASGPNTVSQRTFSVHMDYNSMNRVELAQEILDRFNRRSASGRFIDLRGWFPTSQQPAGRNVLDNLTDTAAGLRARTRPEEVPDTFLSENLLRAILRINDQWDGIILNALAGGMHTGSPNDEHFLGVAVDFQATNNNLVFGSTGGGTWRNSVSWVTVMNFLEATWGFRTQRTHGSPPVRDPGYFGFGGAFHLEIWGRNF